VTAGFITRNKGLEYALEALDYIKAYYSDARYVIVGAPHPSDSEGDAYLRQIGRLARHCGDSVILIDRYVSEEEMNRWLVAADICLLPYTDPYQASSGVLARCLGLGSVIVATEFPYARTLIGPTANTVVPMRDPVALAAAVLRLVDDQKLVDDARSHAIEISKAMSWKRVAEHYASLVAAVT
jgi:glycosyltransferase involved in cell wall biosynthesis